MDVVYILGEGSLCDDEEIRYSMRSLERNMLDLRNVYIVGELPEFLAPFEHVPASDGFTEKWKNAYSKIKKAASLEDLSEEFLLMNDDFFMLEPFTGAEFPFYALKNSNGGTDGMHSFHIHCPIRIKKEWYLNLPLDINSKGRHSPRTFYGNFYKAPPTFCEDFILRAAPGCKDFDIQAKNKPCISVGDDAMLYAPFRQWLEKQFDIPSQYEKVSLHTKDFAQSDILA